jgi:cytosol aminopeptidase family protein
MAGALAYGRSAPGHDSRTYRVSLCEAVNQPAASRKITPKIKFNPLIMKKIIFVISLVPVLAVATVKAADAPTPKENVFDTKPLGIKVSIKMVGPYSQDADLQIICLFKHKTSGDTYQGAAIETDKHLNGILSALRNRGEFVGELGETFLFTPLNGSIPAKQFMVIGLGEEKDLSLDSLRLVGRIAAREAVRLHARHVAWAPVIRDEGDKTIEVGLGDRAFIEQMLSAYDTEKRLQEQGLAPKFSIEDVVIEAGPTFFDSAVKQVGSGIDSATASLAKRSAALYRSTGE